MDSYLLIIFMDNNIEKIEKHILYMYYSNMLYNIYNISIILNISIL